MTLKSQSNVDVKEMGPLALKPHVPTIYSKPHELQTQSPENNKQDDGNNRSAHSMDQK